MTFWVQFLVTTVLVATWIAVKARPDEPRPRLGRGEPFKCVGTELKLEASLHAVMETCRNQTIQALIAAGKKEKFMSKNQSACQVTCLGKELGMIDASGKLVKDKMTKFIVDIFPESKKAELTEELSSCADQYGTGLVNNGGDCGSTVELIRCGSIKIFKICEYIPSFIMQHHDHDVEE